MPAGLTDSLTRPELVDLVRFLSELGKVGPYAVGQARLNRRWEVLEPAAEVVDLLRREGPDAADKDRPGLPWSPAYSRVSGSLPAEAIPKLPAPEGPAAVGLVRCGLDVSTAGRVRLRLSPSAAIKAVRLDGEAPVPVAEAIELDLSAGRYTPSPSGSTPRLWPRTAFASLTRRPARDSPARVQFVLGR